MSDESVDWEFKLIDVLNNCKKKYATKGGWNGLINKIKNDTCYDIPKDRFSTKIKKGGDDVSFSSIELKALYEVADEDDKELLRSLFVKQPRLLALFSREEKVDIFIASTYSKQNKSNVVSRFHLKAYESLQDSDKLQHLDMRFHHVIQRDMHRARIEDKLWYKLLEGIEEKKNNIFPSDTPKITISNPYVNMATEHVLKKIFDAGNSASSAPPVLLCWPDKKEDKKDRDPSVCDISIEDLLEKYPQHRRKITLKEENEKNITDIDPLNCRRCFVIGDEVYASDRWEEFPEKSELTTYGLLILRSFEPINKGNISRLMGCIIGAYAPDNIALAERLFSGKYKTPATLPRLKMQEGKPHVLTIVIENTIGVKDDLKDLDNYHQYINSEEWREVKKIKVVSAVLWCKYENIWEIKSSSNDDMNNNKYIGKFEGKENDIDVRLF